ncbi:hypothetical protein RJ55_02359 [Drechmeria coniospora]|nr:hypothetical protein RJ55_02359 [Drechmeria coniospora]
MAPPLPLASDDDVNRPPRLDLADLICRGEEDDDSGQRVDGPGVARFVNSGDSVEIVEVETMGFGQKRWIHMPNRRIMQASPAPTRGAVRPVAGWLRLLFEVFIPVGFPASVSSDYAAYQTYDSLQAFFSTINSLLANRALLEGLGVGDANSSATFAMILTVMKDATSRISTILFAHRFGLMIEADAKTYRFLADVLNDAAFFLELYSPFLGPYGKVVALCTGEAMRAICGVAAGASKAALSLHFARRDNLSELNAKEASQETAVGLIGLVAGSALVQLVQDRGAVLCLVIALVMAHLWMNYKGVRCVQLTTLNKQRASMIFACYRKQGVVPSPRQVAEEERILFWNNATTNAKGAPVCRVDFGKSYTDAMGPEGSRDKVVVVDGPMHTSFIHPYAAGRLGKIKILLWERAEAKHAILAWFMAAQRASAMDESMPHGYGGEEGARHRCEADKGRQESVKHPGARDEALWRQLEKRGWDLEAAALEPGDAARLCADLTGKQKAE